MAASHSGIPYIHALAVLPEFQRRGVGTALLKAAEACAADEGGADHLQVAFLQLDKSAHRFFTDGARGPYILWSSMHTDTPRSSPDCIDLRQYVIMRKAVSPGASPFS